eukprot:SAG11_NODE_31904_length_288_cov_0.793651_1_plen_59_part_10
MVPSVRRCASAGVEWGRASYSTRALSAEEKASVTRAIMVKLADIGKISRSDATALLHRA